MPQTQRFFCSNCKRPIDEIKIGTKPVPLVVYMVVGQPPDTGAAINLGEKSGVKVPSFIREIMQPHVPTARVELCIPCLVEVFGVKLYTAEDDPMYSVEQTRDTRNELTEANNADTKAMSAGKAPRSAVEQHHDAMRRVLLAVKVGRGALKAPKLPKPDPTLRGRSLLPPRPPLALHSPSPGKARNRARKSRAKPQVRHVAPPSGAVGGT